MDSRDVLYGNLIPFGVFFSGNVCSKGGLDYRSRCLLKMIQCASDGDDVVDYEGYCNHPVGRLMLQ